MYIYIFYKKIRLIGVEHLWVVMDGGYRWPLCIRMKLKVNIKGEDNGEEERVKLFYFLVWIF